jgi:hypothetical protein
MVVVLEPFLAVLQHYSYTTVELLFLLTASRILLIPILTEGLGKQIYSTSSRESTFSSSLV